MPTDRVHDPSDNKHKRGVVGRIQPIENIQPDQKGLNLTDRNPSQQARVRIDAHSWHPLPGRSVREFQARTQRQNARGRGEARTTGKVARNLPWSVFDWHHKRCNCNDRISKPERLIGKLRATLWGNYASTRTVNGPSLTSDTSIIAPNWPVSTCRPRPRRSATTASTRGSASSPGAA